jgi:methylmalonyl-CoA/ethylmalonyl-CoA epimerase
MPAGPFAHVAFLVKDLDQAIEDWKKILAVLDPAQLEQPIVRYDRFEAGGDIMSWATFVNPGGSEIQLLTALNEDGPLGQRLAKRGEGVHHICFTSPDLKGAVRRLVESGVEMTSEELSSDPNMPWQHWTFISPKTSHGSLVEVAYDYRAVGGKWEPGEGVPLPDDNG